MDVGEMTLEHANRLLETLRRIHDTLPGARIRVYTTALGGMRRTYQDDLFRLLVRTGFATALPHDGYEVVPYGKLTLADLVDVNIGDPTPYERRMRQLAKGVSTDDIVAWTQRFLVPGDVWQYSCWRNVIAELHVQDYSGLVVVLAKPISYRPELAVPGSPPVAGMMRVAADAFRLFVERRQLIRIEAGGKKGEWR